MGRELAVLIAMTGCGRLEFSPQPVPGTYSELGPFGAPVPLPLGSTPSDDDPTVTDDGLELYFTSLRSDTLGDTWVSTRSTVDDSWGSPAPVPALATIGVNEENPCVSGDGLSLWLAINYEVHVSTRPTRADAWGAPVAVAELNSAASDAPAIGPTQLRMMMHRGPGSNGVRDLYEATRSSTTSAWSAPTPHTELNTPSDEKSPMLRTDLELWFATNAGGNLDIVVTVRTSTDDPFGPFERVEGVNSPGYDDDPAISPDGRTLVFASDRSGVRQLWEARR